VSVIASDDRSFEWRAADDLSRVAAPLIRDVRSWRNEALVEEIRSRALAGGRGVLGSKKTRAALEEGRVEHLVVAAPDGENEAEELIRRAFETDARVTVLNQGVFEGLTQADGVGALLRW
jgi:stalled ribosome rescue protein Dom34